MTSRPTYEVSMAFGVAPFTDPTGGQWVDVTSYVRGISTRRGRQHELSRSQAGTATITLDNADRRFEPENPASPYYPGVALLTHVRVRAVFSATTYDVFRGFVDNWGQTWPPRPIREGGAATVTIEATDAFKLLGQLELQAYSPEVLADEPVAYWKLDDPAETVALRNLGTAGEDLDLTYANPIAPGNTSTPFAVGNGTSTDFPGTSGQLIWSDVNEPALSLKRSMTLEFYARVESGTAQHVISCGDSGVGDTFWELRIASIISRWEWRQSSNGPFVFVNPAPAPENNVWHHYAFVRDGGQLRYYVDGVLTDTLFLSGQPGQGYPDQPLFLGNSVNLALPFNGKLTHVAVYDRALSGSRIAAHASRTFDTFPEQLPHLYVNELLDYAGWPAGLRDLDTDTAATIARGVPTGNVLEQMLAAAEDTENGVLTVRANGQVQLVSRAQHLLKVANDTVAGDGYAYPPDLGSLQAWYDAGRIPAVTDGATIQTWPDASGNGYDLSQGTAGNRPTYQVAELNGHPVVRFDGTDDLMESGAFAAALSSPFTIVVVAKRATTATADTIVAGRANRVRVQGTTGPAYAIDQGSQQTGGTSDTGWHVLVATFTGTDTLHADGASTISAAAGTTTLDGITVGADEGNADPLNGDVAEVLVYADALTTDERQRIEDYLGRKYGLAAVPAYAGATVGEVPYRDATVRYDDTDLWTDVEVTPEGAEPQQAEDATAISTWGRRVLQRSTKHAHANDALNLAQAILQASKDPHRRPVSVQLEPGQDAVLVQQLARAIGTDRIGIRRRPPGGGPPIAVDALLEGVAHDWKGADPPTTTWDLVPAPATPWILADATYGVLGSTTDLG